MLGERFRIVTSIAMFYDRLEYPNDFVADVASLLHQEGVWIIEMHYLPQVLARNAFDSICHEHLEYYSLAALESLLERHGLIVADAETNEVNGGSLRVYIVHRDSPAASCLLRGGNESARHCVFAKEQFREPRPNPAPMLNSANVSTGSANGLHADIWKASANRVIQLRSTVPPPKAIPCFRFLGWTTT